MMIERLFSLKKSVLFSWLFSYLTFLMLFVIVSVCLYIKTEKTIEKEINKANNILLKQVGDSMDSIIRGAKILSQEILSSNEIQNFSALNGEVTDADRYQIHTAVDALKIYKASDTDIDNIYIIQNKIDMAIGTEQSTDIRSFYRIIYNTSEDAYLSWLKEFDAQTPEKYFIDYQVNGDTRSKVINYVHSFSVGGKKDLSTSLAITIQENSFIEQAKEIESVSGGSVFVLAENNNVIMSTESVPFPENLNFNNISSPDGTIYSRINGKKYVVSYITSNETKWKYVAIIPREIFFGKIQYIRNISYLCILLSIIIGIMLIKIFLKKHYSSVSTLISLLRDEIELPSDGSINEYTFIQTAIKKTLDDKNDISKLLDTQKNILKLNFLETLIKGNFKEDLSVFDSLRTFKINFTRSSFQVLLFDIEISDETLRDACGTHANQDNDLHFIFSNIIEELLSKFCTCSVVYVDNVLGCLINADLSQENSNENLLNAISTAREFINKYFKLDFSVAISSFHGDVKEIPLCYQEALYVMNYKKTLGIEECIFYETIRTSMNSAYYYPIDIEQQLINFIKSGSYNEAKVIFDKLFEENFNNRKLSAELTQCLMLNMINTMIRVINDLTNINKCDKDYIKTINPIRRLLPFRTVEQLRHQIDEFLKDICEHIVASNKDNSNWILNDVVPYINNNYNDINLSISTLADKFNINPIYLSKAFKNQVGEGLLDYINTVRINTSKALLAENYEITLEQVALKSGYSNVRTFIRYFKKFEGITPGKFKEMAFSLKASS